MKKLLLILLLFFPVHGAWAEVIELKCNYHETRDLVFNLHFKDSYRSSGILLTIDTKKGKVNNEWKLTENEKLSFRWKRILYLSNGKDAFIRHYFINRSSGNFSMQASINMPISKAREYFRSKITPKIQISSTGVCSVRKQKF